MLSQKTNYWIGLLLVVVISGSFFRLWQLNDRPMHTDESVHAIKYEALLEKGLYRYDRHEFHGPTLNYFTLVSSFLRGETTSADINAVTLRSAVAWFGIGLIFTPFLFFNGINKRGLFFSALLIAFSPAFVYYSRYYIQETLLVFFTATFLGCGWQYVQSKKCLWAILAGVSIGLMHATKETFVFTLLAAFVGFIFCRRDEKFGGLRKISHLLVAAGAMVLTSVLFYSSFGTNPGGIVDSLTTYGIWFQRSGDSIHEHPWYFYLDLLTWFEFFEPLSWNEDGIVALAVFGLFFAFTRRADLEPRPAAIRFFAVYTVVLTAIYCVIPYKTPWCMLSFLYGMVILAGFALDRLVSRCESVPEKMGVGAIVIIFVCLSPLYQSWMLNFRYSAEPTNPYVYAHTSTDIDLMVDAVERAAASADGTDTPVHIIAAGDDYWPFPWYLRHFTRVGYWTAADESVCTAPIILANASHEQEILNILYTVPVPGKRHLYVPLFDTELYLRRGVPWRGYIRKDLWDRMHAASESILPMSLQKESSSMSQPSKKEIENLLKFTHVAMNTNFQIFIQDERGTYAGRAARAAFHEVDRLEGVLSRFVPNSDVSRINRLVVGEEEVVDEDTMGCLLTARQAYELTDGAFDVTIGAIIDAWKNEDVEEANRLLGKRSGEPFGLAPDGLTVKMLSDHVTIDLGGVGKGYAVDVIAKVLGQWGIERALIHGGGSSVRALHPPAGKAGWPVTISNPADGKVVARLQLNDEVISASGLKKGHHIINPFTGRPVTDRQACWIRMKDSAALADALTTAGMIMPLDAIDCLSEEVPGMSLMILIDSGDKEGEKFLKTGLWPAVSDVQDTAGGQQEGGRLFKNEKFD